MRHQVPISMAAKAFFFNLGCPAETIAAAPTIGPIFVWAIVSWWLHEPHWVSRLAVRLIDRPFYAVPAFLQGLMQHALPWLLSFAALATIFHYLNCGVETPKLSLEARWLAVSSLWGVMLGIVGVIRGVTALTEASLNPLDTPMDATRPPYDVGARCVAMPLALAYRTVSRTTQPGTSRGQTGDSAFLNNRTQSRSFNRYHRRGNYGSTRLVVHSSTAKLRPST